MFRKLPGTLQENHWLGLAILLSSPFALPLFFLSLSLSPPNQFKLRSFSLNFHNRNAQATCYRRERLSQHPLEIKHFSPTPPSSLRTGAELLEGSNSAAEQLLPYSGGGGLRAAQSGCGDLPPPPPLSLPGGPGSRLASPFPPLRLLPPRTHRLAARGRRMCAAPEAAWGRRLRGVTKAPRSTPTRPSPPGVGRWGRR